MGSSTIQWNLRPVVKYHLRRGVGFMKFLENGSRPQPPTSPLESNIHWYALYAYVAATLYWIPRSYIEILSWNLVFTYICVEILSLHISWLHMCTMYILYLLKSCLYICISYICWNLAFTYLYHIFVEILSLHIWIPRSRLHMCTMYIIYL